MLPPASRLAGLDSPGRSPTRSNRRTSASRARSERICAEIWGVRSARSHGVHATSELRGGPAVRARCGITLASSHRESRCCPVVDGAAWAWACHDDGALFAHAPMADPRERGQRRAQLPRLPDAARKCDGPSPSVASWRAPNAVASSAAAASGPRTRRVTSVDAASAPIAAPKTLGLIRAASAKRRPAFTSAPRRSRTRSSATTATSSASASGLADAASARGVEEDHRLRVERLRRDTDAIAQTRSASAALMKR